MHHVRFLERGSIDASVRRPSFPHSWEEHGKIPPHEVVPALKDATIAIVNKTPLPAASLRQLPSLRLIAVAATGTDNIDIGYCRDNGIAVSNIRNYAVHTVPELNHYTVVFHPRGAAAVAAAIDRASTSGA